MYPCDKEVPVQLQTDEFKIVPLIPAHSQLDYEAVMASLPYYQKFNPSDWSSSDFKPEDNLEELKHHEEDHHQRVAFTLSIQDLEGTTAFGCIYINTMAGLLKWLKRPEEEIAQSSDYDCQVYAWTRPSCAQQDLDRKILAALSGWLESTWSFSKVFYQTYEADHRQVGCYQEIGLQQVGVHPLPSGRGNAVIFTRAP